MYSTIQEAWGNDFVEYKPIFKQSNVPEHFRTHHEEKDIIDIGTGVCPCCKRSNNGGYNSYNSYNSNNSNNRNSRSIDIDDILGIDKLSKCKHKDFIQAMLLGILLILILYLSH
jgi:hypothetical protein